VYICTGPLYLAKKEEDGKMYVKYEVGYYEKRLFNIFSYNRMWYSFNQKKIHYKIPNNQIFKTNYLIVLNDCQFFISGKECFTDRFSIWSKKIGEMNKNIVKIWINASSFYILYVKVSLVTSDFTLSTYIPMQSLGMDNVGNG
jgi:hypothetical protein